ncbi:hypothetical protein ACIBBE_35335 [Streptomyces sp. NPDC051644]|uniref:hypothetical protein n=1 Tax=Streptomyces sp. NPDC051644 TaxID=3365666 RepID=UPI00379C55BF
MNNPNAPAEHRLLLAADFTRHYDALTRLRLSGSSPATALTHQPADRRTFGPSPRSLTTSADVITAIRWELPRLPTRRPRMISRVPSPIRSALVPLPGT